MNIFGDKPASLTTFADREQGSGDDFRIAEHVGKGVIVSVHGPKEVQTANYGVKTAISADVVVLNADGTGQEFKDALIFNAAPVDQLKGYAGQSIVAQVTTYTAKSGTQAPKFEAPTPDVQKAAETYKSKA